MDRRKDRHSPGAARWPSSTYPKTKPEGCLLGLSKAFILPEIPKCRKFSLFDIKVKRVDGVTTLGRTGKAGKAASSVGSH